MKNEKKIRSIKQNTKRKVKLRSKQWIKNVQMILRSKNKAKRESIVKKIKKNSNIRKKYKQNNEQKKKNDVKYTDDRILISR